MTVVEFLDECIRDAARIYVRDQLGGKWDSYSLAELPAPQALAHVRRWIAEGRDLLVKVHDPGERDDRPDE